MPAEFCCTNLVQVSTRDAGPNFLLHRIQYRAYNPTDFP